MSSYIRSPLALLRTSSSAMAFFNDASSYSAVNAGIAFRRNHTDEEWQHQVDELKLSKSQIKKSYMEALVGARLCGIRLGDSDGYQERQTYNKIVSSCNGSPFVNIRSDIFWNAAYTIRHENGVGDAPDKSISWREFRNIMAVYSLPWKSKDFYCAGWETISHRASGFHNKASFNKYQDSPDTVWPDHCLPLTRYQVTSTLDRLEALGFFIRHRISKGDRGGLTAYSIKHKSREKLAADCEEWQAFNRGETVRENRAEDALLHAKKVSERDSRIEKTNARAAQILETRKSPENPRSVETDSISLQEEKQTVEPHKHSKPASDLQVPPQGTLQGTPQGTPQHNEKCSNEKSSGDKYLKQKSSTNSGEVVEGLISVSSILGIQTEEEESGYLLNGSFLTSKEASDLMVTHHDLWKIVTTAKRITAIDGTTRIEEAAA